MFDLTANREGVVGPWRLAANEAYVDDARGVADELAEGSAIRSAQFVVRNFFQLLD